jgi:hypothetical protein
MLKSLKENLSPAQKELLAAANTHRPRVLHPWPLLCIPNDEEELETLNIGGDIGCEYGHDLRLLLPQIDEHLGIDDFWFVRKEIKLALTKGMDPKTAKNDPRFHIPDQSVPSPNERLPPKLEEPIPIRFLPEVLLVYDPSNVVFGRERYRNNVQFDDVVPRRYKRKHPAAKQTSNVGHIYLSPKNLCGRGNHSFVYRAAFTLPAPLTARTPTRQVTVLAKLSFPEDEHLDLLHQEGVIYNTFPEWMTEDYCGYNLVRGATVSILVVDC